MVRRVPMAWLQLGREPLRLLVGLAGVAFAVILVFMQLGFRSAMYESATRYHHSLDYDLVLLSPKTPSSAFRRPSRAADCTRRSAPEAWRP